MAPRVAHSCVAREMEEDNSRGDMSARKSESETGAGAADAALMLEEGSALMVDVAPLRATPLDVGAELEEIQFSASLRL
jgi:hypothetical protein